jgi:hypothetical protein
MKRLLLGALLPLCWVSAQAQNSVVNSLILKGDNGYRVTLTAPTGLTGNLTIPLPQIPSGGTLLGTDATGNLLMGAGDFIQLTEPVGAGGTNWTRLQAGAQSSDYTWTLPVDNPTAGDVLTVATGSTSSNVVLEWTAPPTGGGPTGGGASPTGDGSAGALNIPAATTIDVATSGWGGLPGNLNLQFTNVTINGTLIVPSGTIIRATGTVTINGTITVRPFCGEFDPGASRGPSLYGAPATPALTDAEARALLPAPMKAGAGGGATNTTNVVQTSGRGGGGFTIIAGGAVAIGGVVTANGENAAFDAIDNSVGGAGGSGGLIIISSDATITVTGTISANGGNGSNGQSISGQLEAGGGGGGGGIIHLLAPVAPATAGSTRTVNGGAAGADATTPTSANVTAAPPGGSFGGAGGRGAVFNGVRSGAGSNGLILTTVMPQPSRAFVR